MTCITCGGNNLSSHISSNTASMCCRTCGSEWTALVLGGRLIDLPARRIDAQHADGDVSEPITGPTSSGGPTLSKWAEAPEVES